MSWRAAFGPHAAWLCGVGLGFTLGCASSADLADASNQGGQTGSLVPPCERSGPQKPLLVPEGDVVLAAPGITAVEVVDAAGRDVTLMLNGQEQDAVVARAAEALLPGTYTVSYACSNGASQEVTVEVVAAAPLPQKLGDVSLNGAATCDQELSFVVNLTPEANAYAALLELSVQFDAEPAFVLVPFGTVPADQTLLLSVPACSEQQSFGCIRRDAKVLRLRARIAGETLEPLGATLTVGRLCTEGNCAVASRPASRSGAPFLFALALLGTFCARRWRRNGAELNPPGEDPA